MQGVLTYIGAGVCAGILSGMFGIGGGVILVPILVYIGKLSQQAASGTSLVALLLPVGVLGVIEYYRRGVIGPENIKTGLFLALGLFVGAYFGSHISMEISESALRKSFAIFLGLMAVKMWFR